MKFDYFKKEHKFELSNWEHNLSLMDFNYAESTFIIKRDYTDYI